MPCATYDRFELNDVVAKRISFRYFTTEEMEVPPFYFGVVDCKSYWAEGSQEQYKIYHDEKTGKLSSDGFNIPVGFLGILVNFNNPENAKALAQRAHSYYEACSEQHPVKVVEKAEGS